MKVSPVNSDGSRTSQLPLTETFETHHEAPPT